MQTDQPVNILIVDDSAEKILALQAILDELGQNLVKATSGREALRHLLTQDFAVILLDINMPEIDGFETAGLIRQRKRSEDTPIIFITAFGDEDHVWRGYSLGAVDYILTPVVPEVLRAKVSVFVDLFRKTELVKQQADQRVEFAREQAARAAAEEETRRSMFLAEASNVLARSLDHAATVSATARVAVPALGDVCLVSIAPSERLSGRTEVAYAEPGRQQHPPESAPNFGKTLADAARRAWSTGKPEWLASIEHFSGDSQQCRLSSAIVAPLVARGVTLGTLAVGMFDTRRAYTPTDVRLVDDLAGRAAIAIDNARLYQATRDGDRRKDEFLAMLGHELRNPLGAISTALECLELGVSNSSLRERIVIERQVTHLTRLVDDLLDVSRITRGKIQLRKEILDLTAVIDRAVASMTSFITSRGHQLLVSLPPEPVQLKADPTRLEQVFCNLLNNAAKYSEPGGRIWLSAELDAEQVVIRLKDTGIGIQADLLPLVFDLFTQADRSLDRSQGGLGIGLTLAKSLVALHGGEIEAFSAGSGQGSEFTVRLPLWKDAAPARPRARTQPGDLQAAGRPLRIMLVDDNADLAAVLTALLQAAGHEVHPVGSGQEGIETAAAIGMEVGLIDIGLPGMNGYELAQRLRQEPAFEKSLLVAMTGYGQAEDRRRSEQAGFNHHLVKPISVHRLLEILNAWEARSASVCLAADQTGGGGP